MPERSCTDQIADQVAVRDLCNRGREAVPRVEKQVTPPFFENMKNKRKKKEKKKAKRERYIYIYINI